MADPKVIDVPGMGEVEFPADMPDFEIEAIIRRETSFGKPAFWKNVAADLVPGRAFTQGNEALNRLGYKAGGEVTDYLTNKGAGPEISAGLGSAANAAIQFLPAGIGGEAAKGFAPAMEGGAKWLMNNALRPNEFLLKTGKAPRAVNTMLNEGRTVTARGVRKLEEAAKARQKIADALVAQNATKKIDAVQAAANADDLVKKSEFLSKDAADAVRHGQDKFITTHPKISPSGEMTVADAQLVKQAQYADMGDKAYGAGLRPIAERDTSKAIAAGLRKELEGTVTGTGQLGKRSLTYPEANKEAADLINALKQARDRVLIQQGQQPLGLGWLASSPLAIAGFEGSRSPGLKSLAALLMHSGREQIPANAVRYGAGLLSMDEPEE